MRHEVDPQAASHPLSSFAGSFPGGIRADSAPLTHCADRHDPPGGPRDGQPSGGAGPSFDPPRGGARGAFRATPAVGLDRSRDFPIIFVRAR